MNQSVKEYLHYASKVLLKVILHVFWIFPIKKSRITLLNELSFSYGDSMKYLDLYIRDKYPNDFEVVFPMNNISGLDKDDLITVKPMSLQYFFYILTSRVIITNAGGISYLPLKKKQFVINTWHGGGPYKKTALAVYNSKWYKKEVLMNAKNTRYLLSSCKFFSNFEAKTMLFNDEQCIPAGLPRNDIFFKANADIKNKVFTHYNIDDSKKLVLFAPTFRNEQTGSTSRKIQNEIDIDYETVLQELGSQFGGEWAFAIRFHPKMKNIVLDDKSIINMTNYPDMQEILYAADIIIADYSSLMWDFALSYKPCFLYAPDIEEYERTRGFYMPSSRWPYPLAHDNNELIDNIKSFDVAKYTEDLKRHFEDSGSFEHGNACEITLNLVNR